MARLLRSLVLALTAFLSSNACWAQDDSSVKLLQEIRKTCSGVIELTTKNGTGIVTFKNYQLDVQAGKDVEIHQEGVLIGKVQSYTSADYNSCVKDLSAIFTGRKSQNTPFSPSEFVSKLRFGDLGQTSIEYIKSLLGVPMAETERRAHFERDSIGIDVKFLDTATVDGPKGLVVAVKIESLDQTQFSLDKPSLISDRVGADFVFNKSVLEDLQLVDCSFDYFGGIGDNSDPVYFCISQGLHPQGFIDVCLYLDERSLPQAAAKDLWRYITLKDYYEKAITEEDIKKGKLSPRYADNWHYADAPDNPADDERGLGFKKETKYDRVAILRDKIDEIAAKMKVTGLQISYASYIGDLNTVDNPDDDDIALHVPPPKAFR
jgi:hypothetical protein